MDIQSILDCCINHILLCQVFNKRLFAFLQVTAAALLFSSRIPVVQPHWWAFPGGFMFFYTKRITSKEYNETKRTFSLPLVSNTKLGIGIVADAAGIVIQAARIQSATGLGTLIPVPETLAFRHFKRFDRGTVGVARMD